MAALFVFLLLLLLPIGAVGSADTKLPIGPRLAAFLNANSRLFTARRYAQFENKTRTELQRFLGAVRPTAAQLAAVPQVASAAAAPPTAPPASFDIRTKWPRCRATFNRVPDQAGCGSCWAVSAASAIQDRRCIRFNGTSAAASLPISAWDLTTCCAACTPYASGCSGGWPAEAFRWFVEAGVVTGGLFGSGGCRPYAVAPGRSPAASTPCQRRCQPKYTAKTYARDKHFGRRVSTFALDNAAVQAEILAAGSVVATFDVYEDFYLYSAGVYAHTSGEYVGGHAVRIVGWGVAGGVPYWTAGNSWGASWGEKGFFRIRRNTNEVNFESFIVTASALKD
ncbi:Gut-specific cysteine proteinase [Aphelenchoides fujianensis]|nr:Gut-specific cysteine proteinase [Aphelenchoides fujianensis]